MKADQINIVAFAVLGNFQQVEDTEEPRFACQRGSDIGEAYWSDRLDFDFAVAHAVAVAGFYVRTRPDTNAAGDFASNYALAESLGEDHGNVPLQWRFPFYFSIGRDELNGINRAHGSQIGRGR